MQFCFHFHKDLFFRSLSRGATAGALASLVSVASASPAFLVSNTTGQTLANPPFTLGWQFTTTNSITVTDLGLFDDSQNGLAEQHDLGLWNNAGSLLASTTVGAGTANALVNQFRYADIADIVIGPGTYTIGALFLTGSDALIFPGDATGFATAAGIQFGNSAFASGGTLANPTPLDGAVPSYFGPNFLFNVPVNVPEPSALLLVSIALAGLGLSTRRRASTSTAHD